MLSRRQFLRGRISPTEAARRPPWHRPETEFTHLCTRCNDCIAACPTRILFIGTGGFPEVRFAAGECTFCTDCARACSTGAIDFQPDVPAWQLRATIGDACLTYSQTICRSCGEACPTRAIRFSPVLGGAAVPQLDADACNGCGACVGVCPTQAISIDLPAATATTPSLRIRA